MNNFNPNNMLTIYKINNKSLINIGYKIANRKKNYVFELEFLGYLIHRPKNWSFINDFDNVSIVVLHVMHYSQWVMVLS